MLESAAPKNVSKPARRKMMAMFDEARGRKVFHLTETGIDALVRNLTRNRHRPIKRRR